MKIQHFVDNELFEEIEEPEVLILLFKNTDGKDFHIFWGNDDALKELLIHGALWWPMYVPWDQDTREAIEIALKQYGKISNAENISKNVVAIEIFQNSLPEYENSANLSSGNQSFRIQGLRGTKDILHIKNVDTYLIFALQNGKKLIGRNGAGSQKALLVYYAIENFFGTEARALTEDIILGFDKELWYKFATEPGDLKDGIVIIDD